MKFKHSAFIRKNTPEIRKKLEELGHTVGYRYSKRDTVTYVFPEAYYTDLSTVNENLFRTYPELIDCGENEQLFLAIAAIRDDSDYGQWFVCETDGKFHFYDDVSDIFIDSQQDMRKATIKELQEYFKEETL